jgi:CarD family transcriptional regulator
MQASDEVGVPDSIHSDTAAKTPARTAETKSVAAALMAARRKAAPAVAPTSDTKSRLGKGADTLKGMVEVADKNVKTAVLEPDAPAATVVTTPPPSASGMMRRPGQPARPNAHVAVTAPGAKVTKPGGPKGQGFKTNEFIVYPAHGVGEIIAIEEQEVAGYKLELFVISFIKDKMILKVPLPKIVSVGMRKLAEPHVVKRALDTLTGRARIKRTMWSRRAQEYEAKINSGDLVSIAEVVRDLYRSDAQPEQSYSERQLYEAALDRMARELAVVQALTDTEALKVIDEQLRKGPRRGKVEDAEADESEETEEAEGNMGEAA